MAGLKRRKGAGEKDLPLDTPVPVKLSPERREAKQSELRAELLGRRGVKRAKAESIRQFNEQLDQYDDAIDTIVDELEADTEMQKQRDLKFTLGEAQKSLAAVAAASGEQHAFVEPNGVPEGEAPKCARPGCGKFVDEAVHVVAPHPYAGENGGPCACGEAKDSPCHQVPATPTEPVDQEGTPAAADEEGDVFRTDPKTQPHAYQDGPLRSKGGVHLCTDCEAPEGDPRHADSSVASVAPIAAALDSGAGA